jgi:hypothetical protein
MARKIRPDAHGARECAELAPGCRITDGSEAGDRSLATGDNDLFAGLDPGGSLEKFVFASWIVTVVMCLH